MGWLEDHSEVVDYTEEFGKSGAVGSHGLIACHGKGDKVLILRKEDKAERRFDGKSGKYIVEVRYLSVVCEHARDESWACVKGREGSIWQRKELGDKVLKANNLFEHFDLF